MISGGSSVGALTASEPPTSTRDSDLPDPGGRSEGFDRDRAWGMLIGSAVGDAWGGPLEFKPVDRTVPRVLGRPSKEIVATPVDDLPEFPRRLPDYQTFRPAAEPYGVWDEDAATGSVTDDTRLKLILLQAYQKAGRPPSPEQLAATMLRGDVFDHPLTDGWLTEYRRGCRRRLGASTDRPLTHLWGGVPNCTGQMMMTPIAVTAAASEWTPGATYRYVDRLDFLDAPPARDLTAALVVGLAAVIRGTKSADVGEAVRRLRDAMTTTDPFDLAAVPFIGREVDRWIDMAEGIADDARGDLGSWMRGLERRGKPRYYWDAHFTFIVAWSVLHLTGWNFRRSLTCLTAFGHDTDSYAQLAGALAGAVHGPDVMPTIWIHAVEENLKRDYDTDPRTWIDTLT